MVAKTLLHVHLYNFGTWHKKKVFWLFNTQDKTFVLDTLQPNTLPLCHVPDKHILTFITISLGIVAYIFCRLEANDRNHNFGQPDLIEPDFYIDVPDASLYKDVNPDTKFCDFSIDTVVYYLQQYDKELD